MWMNLYLSMLCFFISSFMFSFFFKHLLLTLISLEFMMINMLWNLYLTLNFMILNPYFFNIFICMSICESILGLTLLVYLIRSYGNDFTKTLSMIKW